MIDFTKDFLLAQDVDIEDFVNLEPKSKPWPSIYDIDSCVTCGAVSEFSELAINFVDGLATVLTAPIYILFGSLIALWVAIVAFRLITSSGEILKIPGEAFWVFLAGSMLGVEGTAFIKRVYLASLELMAGSSEAVLIVVNGGNALPESKFDGLAHLMFAVEHVFIGNVMGATQAIWSAASLTNPLPLIYGLIFVIPYFLLIVLYFSKIVVAMFRAMLIAVFAPFLILAAGFNWGRQTAIMGFRTLISSAMVLFAATAAIGICLFTIQSSGVVPEIGDFQSGKEFASVTNPKFILGVIMGWLGVGLMTEGVAIANSITGTLLTNTAAGTITGGLTGSAAFLAKAASGPAGWAAGKVRPAMSPGAQKIFDKMTKGD